MPNRSINIPSPFVVLPFYSSGDCIELASINEDILNSPILAWNTKNFLADIAYAAECYPINLLPPWENPRGYIKVALEEWNKEGIPQIREYFRQRNRHGARPLMIKYIAMYIQLMFWTGNNPVRELTNISETLQGLSYAPMNLRERLSFIIKTPDHHHSFTALKQLYEESNKKWAIYLMKKNKS